MARRSVNDAENSRNAHIDRRSLSERQERVTESIITKGAEQAMHAEIELLANDFAGKAPKLKGLILHDLHLAQHGTAEQVAGARERLAKVGISLNWPIEVLAVVETRLNEASLQVKGTDYKNDPRYEGFRQLFKEDKPFQ